MRWEYEGGDGEFRPFDPLTRGIIEKAYRDQQNGVEIKKDDKAYSIQFREGTMMEIAGGGSSDTGRRLRVKRKEITSEYCFNR